MSPRKTLDKTNVNLLTRGIGRATSLYGVDEQRSLREVPVGSIEPNPHQPRRHFGTAALSSLTDSIAKHGLMQPVCVLETAPNRYQLIAGERRLRAFQHLARDTITALVFPPDSDAAELALIENSQREDLAAVEFARSLDRLHREHGKTHALIAALIGKSQAYVTRVINITRLPPDILADYDAHLTGGDSDETVKPVSLTAMMIIAEANGEDVQRALWAKAKAGDSVRALQAGAARKPPLPTKDAAAPSFTRVLRGLTKNVIAVEAIHAKGDGLSPEQRAQLQKLRDQLDTLLG